MYSFLSNFDLFRHSINLTFNKEKKISSKIGIIFSSLLYLYFIILLFKSDMYLKESPSLNTNTLITLNNNNTMIFEQNNYLSLLLVDINNNSYYDPSIFSIEIRKFKIQTNSIGNNQITVYKSEIIKPSLNSNTNLLFKNQNIAIEKNNENLHHFTISLLMCDNKTSNCTCKSKKEIEHFFETDKLISINIQEGEIDGNDFSIPIKKKNTILNYIIDTKISKINHFHMKKIELISDDGSIFVNNNYYSDLKIDYMTIDYFTRKEGQPLHQLIFYPSLNKDIIKRKYQKLSEFISFFFSTSFFIVYLFFILTDFNFYVYSLQQIANSLQLFQKIKKEKPKKKLIKIKRKVKNQSFQKSKETNGNFSINSNNIDIDDKSKNFKFDLGKNQKYISKKLRFLSQSKSEPYIDITLNKSNKIPEKHLNQDSFCLDHYSENQIKINQISGMNINSEKNCNNELINNNKKNKLFNFGLLEYLKYLIYSFLRIKKNSARNLISKIEKFYFDELDIVKILSRLHEIEKIKLILLNEDQLVLFNCISIDSNYKLDDNKKNSDSIILKTNNKFLSSYENVLKESKTNDICKRLIEFVQKTGHN